MPEDFRTSFPDFSLEFMPKSTTMDHEIPDAVSAPGGPSSTASDPTPPGAIVDDQTRVEVTCGGCRRGLRIRSSYLGRFVVCQHCGQRFLARIEAGRPEDGSASSTARESPAPWPSEPRHVVPAIGTDGFENLAARIRRESRLQSSPSGPRAARSASPTRPSRPRDSSEDRLKGERDSALAEVARWTAELDELRPRLSELEARLSIESDTAGLLPRQDQGRGEADEESRMADRIRALESELDEERAGLGSAVIRHQEALDRLERAHAEARARWADERAGHSEAIERAMRAARSSVEAERDALRTELDLARARAAEEMEGLLARAEQARQSAEEAGQGREAAVRRADDLQRERDSFLARCAELEERGRDLEARLAARAKEAESAAAEAERLHRDEVDGLARDLERARDREEAARQRIASIESQAEGLQAALDLERERSATERKAWEGDRDDQAARLSEELAEARSREDRNATKLASMESRVEELLSALAREAERSEAEKRGRAIDIDEARRQADLDRELVEAEIAGLRRAAEEAERERDAERERAAGLARGADDLAARLAVVEPVLASLRRLEAEMARQSAELALSREEAACASRHNALLLEQLGSHRADWDARRREESVARSPVDEHHALSSPEDRRPDRGPAVEPVAGHGEAGREAPTLAHGESPGRRDPAPVKDRTGGEVVAAVPEARTTSDAIPAPAPTERRRGQGVEVSIALRGVSKEYHRDKFRIPVLQDLDLSVDQGEFLALMGPSGSGKTTLLNLIAGLDQVTTGSIVVHGHELTGLNEAQLTRWRANNVGFVFQMYNLVPVMTAFRNVELPLLLTRLSRRQRRENAMTALRIVGLEGREDHYPRQLSGGQEQRVSIARAIVTDPYLIVADEPTGDLDRKSADEILNLLGSLNREFHKTIVMVTHDPQAAQRATRVLHLDKGKLVGDTVGPRISHAGSLG
jgi:putative ABC transport system ATP-binding protein